MKTMCQFLIVAFVLYFCEQIDTTSAEMKRSIVNGQGAALLFGGSFDICDLYQDLSATQRRICRDQVLVMGSVVEGARLARKECSNQFRNERWDCSSISEGPRTVLGLMSSYATKEAAFNYALVTAGIVQVMARNCMKGDLPSCHCSQESRPQSVAKKHKWGGCGDNIQYASAFSKKFLDNPLVEKLNGSSNLKRAAKLLMDNHNMEVGRQAVLTNRRVICKCHGATSHCTTKTCWYQVQEFNVIGDYLRAKYRFAVKVKVAKRKDGKKIVLKDENNSLFRDRYGLVYTEDAPNYCKKASRSYYYSSDAPGRPCNATITGPGSCDYLCCGRGYKTDREIVSKKCRCKFHWCCDVRCEQCQEEIKVHSCR